MRSAVFSETWAAGKTPFAVRDMFLMAREPAAGDSFAALYGDGARGRFLVWADSPILEIRDTDTAGIVMERSGDLPPILPDLIGYASYEWGTGLEPLVGVAYPDALSLPPFRFVMYAHVLVHDRETGMLHECSRRASDPGGRDAILAAGAGTLAAGFPALPFSARRIADSDDPEGYVKKVEAIRSEIAGGEVYQVNLSRAEEWAYEGDLVDFAERLYRANPAPFSAFIRDRDHAIVSSSPERLVRIANGRLEARPIKGTAPRGATPAEDAALAGGLLSSAKNRAELAMIVDLLRNDLSRACVLPSVRVDDFPVLETYANVHHLVAGVSGVPKPGLSLGELLRAVFPGGSVTGCPKIAAMRLIRQLEARPRGIYTGLLGWFAADMSMLDFNIPIRTIQADGERLRLGLGGAVVWDSDPLDEYLETVHKGRSVVRCLEGGQDA